MISQADVVAIFTGYLPDNVAIIVTPKFNYVETLRHHDYIQQQIDLGIYSETNLENDLLSAVSSYVLLRRVVICYELLVQHMIDVPDDIAMGHLMAVAIHESYHFKAGPTPNLGAHIDQEREANNYVKSEAPEIWELHGKFQAMSPVYQRVYERMRRLNLITEAQEG